MNFTIYIGTWAVLAAALFAIACVYLNQVFQGVRP